MLLEGVNVWIITEDDEKLQEYATKQIGDTTIECSIPSTEGTNFKIQVGVPTDFRPGLGFKYQPRLDGIEYNGKVLPSAWRKNGRDSARMLGVEIASSTVRAFHFGKRLLTDKEEDLSSHSNNLQDLNIVQIRFQWGLDSEPRARTEYAVPKELGPIHEKAAKKGHAGSAGLGNTTIALPGHSTICQFIPAPEFEPLVFRFRYAPEDWLQARGIIESSSSSSLKRGREDSAEVIDIDDLETDDDEIQIVKHLAPVPTTTVHKRQKVKSEGDTKPKPEP
ncbi:hypothetical protein RhiJN_19661 [Ceratobasidium sp. AG-Ba]|nr:hypothetical protein RhiJN_19661 [Ceratobasidium sp. AG-Ba]QRW05710.1 hypothetical protein RhiLY_04709 [Ceratobasidium sp. AG-Ba]